MTRNGVSRARNRGNYQKLPLKKGKFLPRNGKFLPEIREFCYHDFCRVYIYIMTARAPIYKLETRAPERLKPRGKREIRGHRDSEMPFAGSLAYLESISWGRVV